MFMIDTHIHTCLSPCAELDMHPSAIVDAAVRAGLDTIAVCDHNSAENVAAVQRAGKTAGLTVIPGMEITSSEEVHILGLLPDLDAAMELQSKVYRALPGRNDEKIFGMQVIANEFGEVLGFEEHLLSGATTLSLNSIVNAIHDVDGLAIPSHVDRDGFGIIGQLGFIPRDLDLDAIEVSQRMPLPIARTSLTPQGKHPILCASDAHAPGDIARAASFVLMEGPSQQEIRRALAGIGGRTVLGGGKPMEDLALHILDVAQNSADAGSTSVDIDLSEDPEANTLIIQVRDNGPGMDQDLLSRIRDPFFTTRKTRRVGMGLALLAEAARTAGGELEIDSVPGSGTRVRVTFQYRHIDRAPLGDIETTLMVLIAGHPEIDFCFRHSISGRSYELDTRDLSVALEGIGLGSPEGLATLRAAIRHGENSIA